MNQHHGNGNWMSCRNCYKQFGYKNSFDRHVSVCGVKRSTFKNNTNMCFMPIKQFQINYEYYLPCRRVVTRHQTQELQC